MTREEAKEYYKNIASPYVINEIYDDFESRTCENCKYCIDDGSSGYVCKGMSDVIHISSIDDFGCNKFERKENK